MNKYIKILVESVFDDDIFDDNESEEVSNDLVNKIVPYVDLGLPSGTLWAKCNVGAKKPYEYGDYFSWGEIKSKKEYLDDNYTFNDNPEVLSMQNDAAHVNMNDEFNWCMPTKELIEELIECTKNERVDNYNGSGVSGRVFRGINGNELFIPAAGCMFGLFLQGEGYYGAVWSSLVYFLNPDRAYYLYLPSGTIALDECFRYYGLSVRGVIKQ